MGASRNPGKLFKERWHPGVFPENKFSPRLKLLCIFQRKINISYDEYLIFLRDTRFLAHYYLRLWRIRLKMHVRSQKCAACPIRALLKKIWCREIWFVLYLAKWQSFPFLPRYPNENSLKKLNNNNAPRRRYCCLNLLVNFQRGAETKKWETSPFGQR